MPKAIIDLKNVNIYQGESLILSDVNISIEKGEFVYLVGKTGTGKSSLLKTMYGDLELREGQGTVVGHDLRELTWKTVPFLRRNLGVVFQDFQLLTDRNVNENLKFVLKATGWKDEKLMDEKITDVLDKVGLKAKGFKMPLLYIAEMVADWMAMSEEKNTCPYEWADKNIGVRWNFTDKQKEFIYNILDKCWV